MSIAAIEEAIARAGPATEDEPSRPSPPPRYLELDPAYGLSPRASRIDSLVRSIIRDPRWRRREPAVLEALAARVGARQVPAAGPGLIRDVVRRLDALRGLSAFRALRASAAGPEADICDDLEFTLSPGDRGQGCPTVFHGAAELAFRDREGRWNLIVVADAHACPWRNRLRLLLAATAARGRGLEPIARCWLVHHGPDGSADVESVTELGDGEIARAVAALTGESPEESRLGADRAGCATRSRAGP
jgi:hypothetical protein